MSPKRTLVKNLKLQRGDLLLLRIEGFVGFLVWLMQVINRDTSYWTHVAVVLDEETLFEAQPGGARITLIKEYAERPGTVVKSYQKPIDLAGVAMPYRLAPLEDLLTPAIRRQVVVEARSMVHVGYNFDTYVYLALYRFGVRPQWLKNRVQNDDRVICSQAADKVYAEAGVHLFADGRMPYDVTPGDLGTLA